MIGWRLRILSALTQSEHFCPRQYYSLLVKGIASAIAKFSSIFFSKIKLLTFYSPVGGDMDPTDGTDPMEFFRPGMGTAPSCCAISWCDGGRDTLGERLLPGDRACDIGLCVVGEQLRCICS